MFDKSLSTLLYFKGVQFDKQHTNFLYNLLKDDFTDKEFCAMCMDICKTEDLYGKYPDPKLFYNRKKKGSEMILIEEGIFFLDDTIPDYQPFLTGMTDKEVEGLWKWIVKNKRGEIVSKNWIIERIKQFNYHTNQPQIEEWPTLKAMIENHYKDVN